MKEILEEIGFNIGISIAGFFGSVIMIGKKHKANLKTTFFGMITGTASANYLTPVFVSVTGMSKDYEMSVAFVLGFLGVKGVEFVADYLIERSEKK